MRLPADLLDAKAWLIWRYESHEGESKPRKVPYYTSGRRRSGSQGSDEDLAALASYSVASRVAAAKGYDGVGLAMRADLGIVALDFDNCVSAEGEIAPHVLALTEGTYAEFSPSRRGVRAFFRGQLQNRKDHAVGFEVFCSSGYVTVTGQETPDCEMWGWEVVEVSDALLDYYQERFGKAATAAATGDDDWLLSLSSKIGLTIERAKAMLDVLDADIGYDDWLAAGQCLHHEFDGSDAAREVWREWSKGSDKYPGDRTIDGKWSSFGNYVGTPLTAAWLLKHSKVATVVARYEAEGEWKAKVREVEDDYDLREKVCPEIARDTRLGDIERETLAQIVMARLRTLGTPLPIKSVRKLLTPPSSMVPTVKQSRPMTEFGNAERMLDRFGRSLMYVPELAAWHVWTGVYWRRASEVEIEHYAKETVSRLKDESADYEGSSEFWAFCAISQQARMVRNMVALAASDPRVMVPVEELDREKYMLGVQNGVVDLRTGKLMPPDSDMRVTRVCSCNYRPGARAELWQRTVLDVFNDDLEMSAFFQRLVGYMALGNPTEDIMVIAHGNGSNGKSTVFGTLRKVLGGYARSANAETFVADGRSGNAGGAREDLVRLRGARMVYVNEPDEQGELREGTVKGMTGGDAITARGLWAKESIEFMPSWVVVMPTNHKPIVKGSDNGIWRRLMLIPFTRNFENDPKIVKDDKREQKLDAEAEGVLAYIVEGARAYLRDGLSPPSIVRNAREQYRSQMDLLSEWVEDRCEVNVAFREQTQRLWQSWEEYARERGILRYVPSSIALGRRLDQRFPSEKGPRGVRMRIGLRLKEGEMYRDDFFDDIS